MTLVVHITGHKFCHHAWMLLGSRLGHFEDAISSKAMACSSHVQLHLQPDKQPDDSGSVTQKLCPNCTLSAWRLSPSPADRGAQGSSAGQMLWISRKIACAQLRNIQLPSGGRQGAESATWREPIRQHLQQCRAPDGLHLRATCDWPVAIPTGQAQGAGGQHQASHPQQPHQYNTVQYERPHP